MPDALREALPKLPKRAAGPSWTPKSPKGVIAQDTYDQSRAKKASWTPK